MSGDILNNSRGKTFIKLFIGITFSVLLVGVAYGLFFLPSHSSVGDNVVSVKSAPHYPIRLKSQAEPEPQEVEAPVATPPPLPPAKKLAPAMTVAPLVEKQEETWQETDEPYTEEESVREQVDTRAEEIKDLKAALPGNNLIPFERTQEEAEALLVVAQEVGAISESIENNTATIEDRQRYLDIIDQQLDDEIELIAYCEEMMANPDNAASIEMCSQISKMGDQRIQEIEDVREDLRNKIMQ